MSATHALGRHVVLVGFMGAGKSTLGPAVARRLGRPFVDVDDEIERAHGAIAELFEREGEAVFREVEARFVREALGRREDAVIAVGGGAVETGGLLGTGHAFVVHVHVGPDTAWARVQASERPLARDEAEFRRRYERRAPLYADVADAVARDEEDVVLAAAGIEIGVGAIEVLGSLVPGGDVALVTDPRVGGIHGAAAQLALGDRLRSAHEVPAGEEAKTAAVVARLWRELRLPRSGTIVALGGGCVTDTAGLAAATYVRGVDWMPVPTTLVGDRKSVV